MALAAAEDALSVPAAALGAVAGQLGGHPGDERDLLLAAVVVVNGQKPVARLQVVAGLLLHHLLI